MRLNLSLWGYVGRLCSLIQGSGRENLPRLYTERRRGRLASWCLHMSKALVSYQLLHWVTNTYRSLCLSFSGPFLTATSLHLGSRSRGNARRYITRLRSAFFPPFTYASSDLIWAAMVPGQPTRICLVKLVNSVKVARGTDARAPAAVALDTLWGLRLLFSAPSSCLLVVVRLRLTASRCLVLCLC